MRLVSSNRENYQHISYFLEIPSTYTRRGPEGASSGFGLWTKTLLGQWNQLYRSASTSESRSYFEMNYTGTNQQVRSEVESADHSSFRWQDSWGAFCNISKTIARVSSGFKLEKHLVLLFSSVWKPDETRRTSFWHYLCNKENKFKLSFE